MTSSTLFWIAAPLVTVSAAALIFVLYAFIRFTPIISRMFESSPLLIPLRVSPRDDAEIVRFPTQDGLSLAGAYLRRRTQRRTGVLIFCHEYLSDRWSCLPYVDHLRDLGFDVFSFDFRNHGESDVAPSYRHLQWVTDHEASDLRAAIAYLKTRPDHDTAGVGLFGVSRGGCAALTVAGGENSVWAIVTDGAFPTRGTMLSYILRWTELYVRRPYLRVFLPTRFLRVLGWAARRRSEGRLGCRFTNVERAVKRIAPRPWLAIHGARDAYIGPDIARRLFAIGGEPKEFWLVHDAKHNRCREVAPELYAERLTAFMLQHAPRRFEPDAVPEPEPVSAPRVARPEPRVTSASAASGSRVGASPVSVGG